MLNPETAPDPVAIALPFLSAAGSEEVDGTFVHRVVFEDKPETELFILRDPNGQYLQLTTEVLAVPQRGADALYRILMMTNDLTALGPGIWFSLDGEEKEIRMHFRLALRGLSAEEIAEAVEWFLDQTQSWVGNFAGFDGEAEAQRAAGSPPPGSISG